jgi:hypothetical protein
MTDTILGYTWEAIQRAQRGGKLSDPVPLAPAPIAWDASDDDLLAKYPTAAQLEAAGFYGVADRAKRLGKL